MLCMGHQGDTPMCLLEVRVDMDRDFRWELGLECGNCEGDGRQDPDREHVLLACDQSCDGNVCQQEVVMELSKPGMV